MPSSPSSSSPSRSEQMDRIFHALSDRTRRSILERLALGPALVSEIAAPIRLTRMAVSKHVRVLEEAQLIRREIIGREHRCSLATEPLQDVDAWLGHYRSFWRGTLQSLARFVEEDQRREVGAVKRRRRKG